MNYNHHYRALIDRASTRNLTPDIDVEVHHIIPKCLGGTNSKDNLVELTPEEHFVAHQLLVKIYPTSKKLVLALSAMRMSNKSHSRNNKMYGWIKRANVAARKGVQQTVESNMKRKNALKGRKTSIGMLGTSHRQETKNKISVSQIGKMKTSSRTIYAWLRTPAGEEILFGPLLHECKKYNLILEYVSDLCKNKKESYKGWTFSRFATAEERYSKIESLKLQGLMI